MCSDVLSPQPRIYQRIQFATPTYRKGRTKSKHKVQRKPRKSREWMLDFTPKYSQTRHLEATNIRNT